jgi:hypothetical protein
MVRPAFQAIARASAARDLCFEPGLTMASKKNEQDQHGRQAGGGLADLPIR